MSSVEVGQPLPGASALGSWSEVMTPLSIGRSFFGLAMVGSGVEQLVTGAFVRLVPKGPFGAQLPSLWPYVVGVVLIAAGLAILAGRMVRLAGIVVVALILVSLVLRQIPQAITNPWAGFMWTNPLKALALIGGGVLVAATSSPAERPAARLEALGRVLLAAFLTVCGVQHYVYHDFVATLVPSWIPVPMFWTYFTGTALIAGGVGMLVRPTARLAATLSAVMIFLWVPMVHVPRALAGPDHANETAGVFEALAVSGVASMVAGTRARRPRHGGESGRPS